MKRRFRLICLLLLVTVLVDCAVVFAVRQFDWGGDWHVWKSNAANAVLHGQAVLLAIWAGLGGGPLPWRLAGMVAGIALCTGLEYFDDISGIFVTLTMARLAQVFHVVTILLAARLSGLGLPLLSEGGSCEVSHSEKPKLQFSLGYLLGWTTGFAVLLAILRCIGSYEEEAMSLVIWWRDDALMLVSIAVIALAAVWTALGTRWPVVRVLLLGLSVAAESASAAWEHLAVYPFFLSFWWRVLAFSSLPHAAWIVGSLWVFRIAGYRLVWRRPVLWEVFSRS